MVLIFSINNDITTDIVIGWLNKFKVDFIRVDRNDRIIDMYYEIGNVKDSVLVLKNMRGEIFKISFNEIKSIWFRRSFNFDLDVNNNNYDFDLINYYTKEISAMKYAFNLELVRNYKHIGNPNKMSLNKIDVLLCASKIGMKIPSSFVVSNKEQIRDPNIELITKPISECYKKINGTEGLITYTAEIKYDLLPDVFFPSLIQNKINKKFEVRTFYLNKKSYSMAIFSQGDKKTEVDFRNYNEDNPNRVVPFKLPNYMDKMLIKLMNKLELNSGSIDFIVDEKKEFVFLEVNPVGQFGMVSSPCNYYLEELIAKTLI